MKKYLVGLFLFFTLDNSIAGNCQGRFLNPITDICWSCLFPMAIGPMYFDKSQKGGTALDFDSSIPTSLFPGITGRSVAGTCFCSERLPEVPAGVLMSWYEPSRLVDVTRTPFCMVGLGGLDLGKGLSKIISAPEYGDDTHGLNTQGSFYQVHWYYSPIMLILGILDAGCNMGASKSFDVLFLSEIDPFWNDDNISFIFSPEVVLFTSMPAQLACSVDCIASSLPYSKSTLKTISFTGPVRAPSATNTANILNPSKYLFWCGGCQGALYPLNGNNSDSIYPVQSSVLTALKTATLMHRMGLQDKTTGALGMCNNLLPNLFIDKSEWKYSMGFPVPQSKHDNCCNAFGETDTTWNSGASFPKKGEDFTYIMYHQRDCCFL